MIFIKYSNHILKAHTCMELYLCLRMLAYYNPVSLKFLLPAQKYSQTFFTGDLTYKLQPPV